MFNLSVSHPLDSSPSRRALGIPQGLLLSPEALKSVCGESVQLLFLAALLDDQSHSTSGHNGQHQDVRSIVEDEAIDTFIERVGKAYKEKIGYAADFYVVEIGDGPQTL